jgi:arylsulfatase A-like enzyme
LICKFPGVTKSGTTTSSIVSNVDFAQTFLEAAGVKAPADMQGASLMPLLKGETPADWRKSFYYHYYEFPGAHSVRKHYGVVTDEYKLVRFYGDDVDYWELFDRKSDPLEMKSVFADPAYAVARKALEGELARLRIVLEVTEQDPIEKRNSK